MGKVLQDWNRQNPDNTFALTAGLLEITFRIHRSAAHDFLNEYRAQIDDHHQALSTALAERVRCYHRPHS